MWGHFPNSLLMNNLVASQVTDCSRELDEAAQCLEMYATLRSRMRNRHDFRRSRAVRLHEIVAELDLCHFRSSAPQNADADQAFIDPFRPTVFGSRLDP
jgi:hypothetical protein